RVAASAPGLPRGLVELVLAAVPARARNRTRIPAGLALRDPLQLGRHPDARPTAARPGRGAAGVVPGAVDPHPKAAQRSRAGHPVGREAVPALEALDRRLRLRAEVAADRAHVELALELLDSCPSHPVLERVAAAGARQRDARG